MKNKTLLTTPLFPMEMENKRCDELRNDDNTT